MSTNYSSWGRVSISSGSASLSGGEGAGGGSRSEKGGGGVLWVNGEKKEDQLAFEPLSPQAYLKPTVYAKRCVFYEELLCIV